MAESPEWNPHTHSWEGGAASEPAAGQGGGSESKCPASASAWCNERCQLCGGRG